MYVAEQKDTVSAHHPRHDKTEERINGSHELEQVEP